MLWGDEYHCCSAVGSLLTIMTLKREQKQGHDANVN